MHPFPELPRNQAPFPACLGPAAKNKNIFSDPRLKEHLKLNKSNALCQLLSRQGQNLRGPS